MTQNLSQAQWELISTDLLNILRKDISHMQLRSALLDWLEKYGDLDSGYRVDRG